MPYCKNCGSEMSEDAAYCPKCGAPVEALSAPKLAYWGDRFVAWLIDIVILGAAINSIRLFLWVGWPTYVWPSGVLSWVPFFDFGFSNVVYFLYWVLMDGAYGQSIGKMIMRIKVTKVDGAKINMGQAAIEAVGKAFILPLDCLLGWILYPSRRQRAFNFISNTIVVKVQHRAL